jgi:hypothetical protein
MIVSIRLIGSVLLQVLELVENRLEYQCLYDLETVFREPQILLLLRGDLRLHALDRAFLVGEDSLDGGVVLPPREMHDQVHADEDHHAEVVRSVAHEKPFLGHTGTDIQAGFQPALEPVGVQIR